MCARTNTTPPQIASQSGSMAKCLVCEERPATEFHSEFDGKLCSVCNERSKGEAGWDVRSSHIELPYKDLNENVLSEQSRNKGNNTSTGGSTLRCAARRKKRCCEHEGCTKWAQGSTSYCKAHGGGTRCEHEGCTKSAIGSTSYCKAHGGGKRCEHGGGRCNGAVSWYVGS